MNRRARLTGALAATLAALVLWCWPAAAQQPARPNILIIWGDDIGWYNISAYNRGVMGYQTPNIDRLASEGALFTDWYGQQSCTAGRACFITGQSGYRTGLLKVGLPGAKTTAVGPLCSPCSCRNPCLRSQFRRRSPSSHYRRSCSGSSPPYKSS